MTPRRLTLCADDYAQSPAISQGILALLQRGRLSATSVMTQSPHWPALAAPLREMQPQADIGLHFNLTHDFGSEPQLQALSHWLLLSQLRLLSRAALRDSLLRQIDQFSQQLGRLPTSSTAISMCMRCRLSATRCSMPSPCAGLKQQALSARARSTGPSRRQPLKAVVLHRHAVVLPLPPSKTACTAISGLPACMPYSRRPVLPD
jgi:hypothetical protein